MRDTTKQRAIYESLDTVTKMLTDLNRLYLRRIQILEKLEEGHHQEAENLRSLEQLEDHILMLDIDIPQQLITLNRNKKWVRTKDN